MKLRILLAIAVLTLPACGAPKAPPPPEPTPVQNYDLGIEGLAGILAWSACAAEPIDTREHFAKYLDQLVALGDDWNKVKLALQTNPNNSSFTVLWNVINYVLGTTTTAEIWNSEYPRVAIAAIRGCQAGLTQPMGVN